MYKKQAPYYHAFSFIKGLGPRKMQTILQLYDYDLAAAWNDATGWIQLLPEKNRPPALKTTCDFSVTESFEKLQSKNIQIICFHEKSYPYLLKDLPDAPTHLYTLGSPLPSMKPSITVVGTRKITRYGKTVLEQLIPTLAQAGISVISGLALGVDGLSHKLTLDHGGYTIAVLGSGFEHMTPSSHHALAQRMIEQGSTIVTEFPPHTQGSTGTFPRRNRILAGLSPLTLVIEAAKKSGALITADFALDYNRDVAAIPGSIFSPLSAGTNNLISQGASLIQSPEELLTYYGVDESKQEFVEISLSPDEEYLLEIIGKDPVYLEILQMKTQWPVHKLLSTLSTLEIKGILIKQANQYQRSHLSFTFDKKERL